MTKENKTKLKALRIKNSHIEKIIDFLDVYMNNTEARLRNNFVKVLGKQLIFLGEERIKLLEEYAEKDKEGKPKKSNDGKSYDIIPENLEKVKVELTTLYDDFLIIDILPSNEEEIKVATKAILQSTKTFDIADGAIYSAICETFEEIK